MPARLAGRTRPAGLPWPAANQLDHWLTNILLHLRRVRAGKQSTRHEARATAGTIECAGSSDGDAAAGSAVLWGAAQVPWPSRWAWRATGHQLIPAFQRPAELGDS